MNRFRLKPGLIPSVSNLNMVEAVLQMFSQNYLDWGADVDTIMEKVVESLNVYGVSEGKAKGIMTNMMKVGMFPTSAGVKILCNLNSVMYIMWVLGKSRDISVRGMPYVALNPDGVVQLAQSRGYDCPRQIRDVKVYGDISSILALMASMGMIHEKRYQGEIVYSYRVSWDRIHRASL